MKKGLILMAFCLCLAAVTSFSAPVWTSDVAFDGTPTSDTVVLKPTDNIGYSTALVGGEWKVVTVKVNDVTDPSVQIPNSGTIFQTPYQNVEFEGSFNWNYTSLNLPKNDTYRIFEEIESTSDDVTAYRYFTIVPEPTVLLFAGILGAFFLRRRAKALLAFLAALPLAPTPRPRSLRSPARSFGRSTDRSSSITPLPPTMKATSTSSSTAALTRVPRPLIWLTKAL